MIAQIQCTRSQVGVKLTNNIMLYFFIVFFIFILILLLLIVAWSLKNGIGPMPTAPKAKKVLLDHLPQSWKGTIYELGAGWGTLAFPIAKKYPNCTVVAYENSPIPYLFLRLRLLFSRSKNLEIKFQNFFLADFEDADMIVCYLYPGAMRKLKEKFEEELKHGALIVSNTFSIPGWNSFETYVVPDMYRSQIYMYIV